MSASEASVPLLEARSLSKTYTLPRESLLRPAPTVQALRDVSFSLQAGKTLGVVGESGSGKSTLARLVMALERPTAGEVRLDGVNLHALNEGELRAARVKFQMVFQDPYGSLDPRMTVLRTVTEPLAALRSSRTVAPNTQSGQSAQSAQSAQSHEQHAAEMLEAVGLSSADLHKYPHQFSGGQRQRIALARALITRPCLIVADEPVSALDVSVQAQVLNLMQDLQERFGVAYLFVSHDLAVVDLVSDEVLVLQHGEVVERGPADQVFNDPQHPYTRSLVAARL